MLSATGLRAGSRITKVGYSPSDDIDAEKAPQRISESNENCQDNENSFQHFVWNIFPRPGSNHRSDENTHQFGTDHGPVYLHAFKHHEIENGEDHSNQDG